MCRATIWKTRLGRADRTRKPADGSHRNIFATLGFSKIFHATLKQRAWMETMPTGSYRCLKLMLFKQAKSN